MLLLERDEQFQVSPSVFRNVHPSHLTITLRSAPRIVSRPSGRATHPGPWPGYHYFMLLHKKNSRLFPLFFASVGAFGLAGCGGGDPIPAASSATAPSSTTSPTYTVTATTPTSTSPPPQTSVAPAGNELCGAGDVKLTLGEGDAAAGSLYRPLLITNTKAEPCTVQGFPGVSYVAGDDGHQVGEAAYRTGTKGNPIKLNTGQTAASVIQFVNVHNYPDDICRPTPVRGLRIYLPQETDANFVPMPGTGCANSELPGNQLAVKTVGPA